MSFLIHGDRRDAVVPGMSASKRQLAQISDVAWNHGATATEVAVVEDAHTCAAKDADGRDVIAEVAGQSGQAVSGTDTEVVSAEGRGCIEAGAAARIGALVPRR